jgi:hypothetical protein
MQTNASDNRSSTRPLTVAAGHPFFENSEKIQRCFSEAKSKIREFRQKYYKA